MATAPATTLEDALARIAALEAENALLKAQQEQQLLEPLLQSSTNRANDGRADSLKTRSFEMTGDVKDQDRCRELQQPLPVVCLLHTVLGTHTVAIVGRSYGAMEAAG